MKIISWSLLIITILLLTFTSAACVECKWPGSVSWIILEIDYWISFVWGWIWLVLFILVVLAVVGLIIFKVGPLLVSLFRKHRPIIVATTVKVANHPKGRKILVGLAIVFLIIFLISGFIAALWIMPLIF